MQLLMDLEWDFFQDKSTVQETDVKPNNCAVYPIDFLSVVIKIFL